MEKIVLPELGEGVDEAVITTWHFSAGKTVEQGSDIVELATDKATFNVPSPVSGVIKKIVRQEGETVKVGDVLAEIE